MPSYLTVISGECLDCGAPIALADDSEIGEIVICEECGLELEITDMDGDEITFSLAPEDEEEEDWDE